jgi:hypothetical protein
MKPIPLTLKKKLALELWRQKEHLLREDAEPARIRIAPHGDKLKTAHELRFRARGQYGGGQARKLPLAVIPEILSFKVNGTARRRQRAHQRFEQGGLARAVGADEAQDLSRPGGKGNV